MVWPLKKKISRADVGRHSALKECIHKLKVLGEGLRQGVWLAVEERRESRGRHGPRLLNPVGVGRQLQLALDGDSDARQKHLVDTRGRNRTTPQRRRRQQQQSLQNNIPSTA